MGGVVVGGEDDAEEFAGGVAGFVEEFRARGDAEREYILPELLRIGWSDERPEAQRDASQASFNFRLVEVVMMALMPLLAVALGVPPKRSSSALGVFLSIVMVVAYHKVNQYGEDVAALERDRIFRQDPSQFDLVISSAMDLQFKAANDGLALPIEDVTTPDWAQWRQSLFAFTTEPAAIVIRRADFAGRATARAHPPGPLTTDDIFRRGSALPPLP